MSLIDASNISTVQATKTTGSLPGPAILDITDNVFISVSDLAKGFQHQQGLLIRSDEDNGYSLTLPSTESLLNMFAHLVNRPLVDGDLFILNINTNNRAVNLVVGDNDSLVDNEAIFFELATGEIFFVIDATNSLITIHPIVNFNEN